MYHIRPELCNWKFSPSLLSFVLAIAFLAATSNNISQLPGTMQVVFYIHFRPADKNSAPRREAEP